MKIWAHRGCSQRYPENTITSFKKACEIPGLTGIELDIQLSKDGELVVIHDERLERTTNGFGFVKDYTLVQLKEFSIWTGQGFDEHIPTMEEVLDVVEYRMRQGMLLNIELKTSVYPYPGIEKKIVDLIASRGLDNYVIYSSFSARSLIMLHACNHDARVGMLDCKVSDCLLKAYGLESIFYAMDTTDGHDGQKFGELALHPHWRDMDFTAEHLEGRTVRAWFTGHLFPDEPTGKLLDLSSLEAQGITDIFINEPERYL